MKRTICVMVLLVMALGLWAQDVLYRDQATLQWDAVLTDAQGTSWLPTDVIEYEVYLWDMGGGAPNTASVVGWDFIGITAATEMLMVFSYRAEWAAGVLVRVTDAGGNAQVSDLAWSGDAMDVQGGVPFMYVPLLQLAPPAALRDSGT